MNSFEFRFLAHNIYVGYTYMPDSGPCPRALRPLKLRATLKAFICSQPDWIPERYLCVYVPLGCGELQLNLHLYDFFPAVVNAAGEIPWRRKHLSLLCGDSTSATATILPFQLNLAQTQMASRSRRETHNKTKTFIISYEFLVAELATISRDMQLTKSEQGRQKEEYRIQTASQAKSGPSLITGWPAEWPKRKCLNLMT